MLRADLVVRLVTSCSRHLADCDVVVVPFIVVVVFAFNRWENRPCELFLSVRSVVSEITMMLGVASGRCVYEIVCVSTNI